MARTARTVSTGDERLPGARAAAAGYGRSEVISESPTGAGPGPSASRPDRGPQGGSPAAILAEGGRPAQGPRVPPS